MAATIGASVGIKGVNVPTDVVTVQTLLNKIDRTQGGPAVKLVPDGICGTKTNTAIQQFQLKHFGWKGADGRVDPGGATLQKLNELSGPPGPQPPVVSGTFELRQATVNPNVTDPKVDFCFRVEDALTRKSRGYFFQPPGLFFPGQLPTTFPGKPNLLAVSPQLPINGLGGPASYITRFQAGGPTTFLQLSGAFGTRVFALATHLSKGDGVKIGGALGKSTPTSEEISGAFLVL